MSECSLAGGCWGQSKAGARLIIIVGRNDFLMTKISAFAQLEGARHSIERFTDYGFLQNRQAPCGTAVARIPSASSGKPRTLCRLEAKFSYDFWVEELRLEPNTTADETGARCSRSGYPMQSCIRTG
jgi:hypothetical protein